MNKRTLWIATGTLGVMAIGAGSAVADSAFEKEDLGQSIVQVTEAPALAPVVETSVSPAAVTLDQQDVNTAVSSAQSAPSPVSAQSAASPASAQSAPSPVSAQSAASPASAQSAASAPSAQSAD
jgi:hypothetical protein